MKKNKKTKVDQNIENGLVDVVMGGVSPYSIGTQVNQTDSFFNNVRTYLISNMRQILSQVYCEHGLIQTVVNVPVDDAFKGGFEVKTQQLEEEEIKKLNTVMEHKGDIETAKQALKWTRLYGGGGIVIMTDQFQDKPLETEQSKLQELEFRAVDMWELFSSQQNIDDDTRRLDIGPKKDFCFNYYAINLHNSRVIVLKGIVAPSFVRPRLRGWGFSVVESLVSSINQFLKTKNLTYEVLDEFKLDIFKIKGFNSAIMSKDGMTKIQNRVQLANMQKNYQNALTMDTEDDHQSKQLNFSGLSDIQKDIRIQIASDLRMPLTKLFGLSATGFNSGEDDIEVYNSMIESEIRPKAKLACLQMVKLRCQELFGFVPDDLELEFKNLRLLTHEQEENVKNQKANRLIMFLDKGLISIEQAKDAINRGNLVDVKVDVSDEKLSPDGEDPDTDLITDKDLEDSPIETHPDERK